MAEEKDRIIKCIFFQLMKEKIENLEVSGMEEIKLSNRHLGKKNQ